MMKNLQGMLSPSKKKRSFKPGADQSIAVDDAKEYQQEATGADHVSTNTPEDRKSGRFLRMNVLKTPPKLTDDDVDGPDAKKESPGAFTRRRASIGHAKEEESKLSEQLSVAASYDKEEAEKKAGIKGNIRGFFNRRKSTLKKESEELVLSPAGDDDIEEDSEVEDVERSYLEEIFKRKQASMHSVGQDEEEQSESQFSSAENNNNIASDKSRRGRRRSVTKLIAEARKREEEKGAVDGNSPVGGKPVVLDNISRRRRRSMNIRSFEASPSSGGNKNVSDFGNQQNSMRLRRSSMPSVEDDRVKADATDRRTRRGCRSIPLIEENKGSKNWHDNDKGDFDDRQVTTRQDFQVVGNIDDENILVVDDRRTRRSQRIIQDPVDKHASTNSENEIDRKSRRNRTSFVIRDEGGHSIVERDRLAPGDKKEGNDRNIVAKPHGDTYAQTRENIVSDRQLRGHNGLLRDRSRSPVSRSKSRLRSRSKSRNRVRSPTRKRSKSRTRTSEFQESRERRRSRSRHRPSLVSSKKNDDGQRRHGNNSTDRDRNSIREGDNSDKQKNHDRDIFKEGNKGKDRDRYRERGRDVDQGRRCKDELAERGSHAIESKMGDRRSRRKSINDGHFSPRSYLSDSASTFDSFLHPNRNGNASSNIEEASRGAYGTANQVRLPTSRGRMSKSKNKLKNCLPSDERSRSKQNLEMRSPSSLTKNKQKIRASGKSTMSKTERDFPEENSQTSLNDDACDESFSEGTDSDALVNGESHEAKKVILEHSAAIPLTNVHPVGVNRYSGVTSRLIVQEGNESIYDSKEANDKQGITDPGTPPSGRRPHSRRVALTSILDSDNGGEREADILSLSPGRTKPSVGSPSSLLFQKLNAGMLQTEDRSATLGLDRDGKSGSASFSGFRSKRDSGRDFIAPEQSKLSHSFGHLQIESRSNVSRTETYFKGGRSLSVSDDLKASFNHYIEGDVSIKSQSNKLEINNETVYAREDEDIDGPLVAEQMILHEPVIHDLDDGVKDLVSINIQKDLDRMSRLAEVHEMDSHQKRNDHKEDKIQNDASEGVDATFVNLDVAHLNLGVSERLSAANISHPTLPIESDGDKAALNVTEPSDTILSGNEMFEKDEAEERFHSDVDSAASYRKASKGRGKLRNSKKVHVVMRKPNHTGQGDMASDNPYKQTIMVRRTPNEDDSATSLEESNAREQLLSHTETEISALSTNSCQHKTPEEQSIPLFSTEDLESHTGPFLRTATSTVTLTHKDKVEFDVAPDSVPSSTLAETNDGKNRNLIETVGLSREKGHGSEEAKRCGEIPTQDSILSSPVSRRSHDKSKKSMKGVSKRGDKHARTKSQRRDHHDNTRSARKQSLSPPRKSERNRRSKDAGSPDSKMSSWKPPRLKERVTDTSGRKSEMRRRRSSHRMESLRESKKNDETPVEYDEEDVFTLYTWSGNRQDKGKIQRERLALKNSIRPLSLFSAYENIERD